MTGTSTDIGLIIGQIARGNSQNAFKLILLILLTISFCLGATVSIVMIDLYGFNAILPNAILMLVIGIISILFLSNEYNVTFWEALSSTGGWDQAFHDLNLKGKNKSDVDKLFDTIDSDKKGFINYSELCKVIEIHTNKKASDKYISKLFVKANSENNALISRENFCKSLERFL